MNFFFRPQRSQLTRKRTHNRVCSVQPRCPTAISAVPPPQRRLSIKITTLGAAPLAAAAPSVRRGLRDPGLRAPLAAAPWPGSGHLGRGLAGVDAVVLRDRAGDAGAGAGLGGRRGQRGAAGSMPAKIRPGARCRGMAGTGLGAKARVARNLGEICRGECRTWVTKSDQNLP